jgi:hypothetical protein
MTTMINLCILIPLGWLVFDILLRYVAIVGFLPCQILIEELIQTYGLEEQFILASFLRYVLIVPFAFTQIAECFRTIPLILIFFVTPIQLYLRCYTLLGDFQVRQNALTDSRKFRILFFKYDQLRIMNNEAQPYIGLQVSFLLLAGAAFSVIANFATVRTYDIFPWYLYLVNPMIFILICLLIQLLLPFGINCNEGSESMLRQWKSDHIYAKGKYLRR